MQPGKLLGLGTASIGRPQYINIKQEVDEPFDIAAFRKKGIAVLDDAYAKGIRYFDTAPGYGMAEQLLIEWLQGKDDDTIEVATKWGYTYTANFDPHAKVHEVKEHSVEKLSEQWLQSEKLLPYLTTYQIHSATFETGVLDNKAVIDKLYELKEKHQLNIGITTSGANQVEVVKTALTIQQDNVELFDVFQCTYNVLEQSIATINDLLLSKNKRLIIKEAMANGRIFPNAAYGHYGESYKVLQQLSDKYKTGVDAVALRFCMNSLNTYSVLSGAASTKQLKENMQAGDFVLEKEDIALLQSLEVSPAAYWNERKQLSWQ